MAIVESSSLSFQTGVSPSITAVIDLSSGDVTTNLLPVTRTSSFTIDSINATGLNGVPTWSLIASNVNDVNEAVKYTDDSNDLDLTDSIINRSFSGVNFFAIEIKTNGNSTGTIEFIYTPII